MASIFTKIINNEIPAYKIAENDNFISILDINPLQKGHALVIPKIEVDYIFDNSDYLLSEMLPFAKKVAKAIESVVECKRIGIVVIGLEVPHTHIHLIPMNEEKDINFSNKKLSLSKEEFEILLEKIKENL